MHWNTIEIVHVETRIIRIRNLNSSSALTVEPQLCIFLSTERVCMEERSGSVINVILQHVIETIFGIILRCIMKDLELLAINVKNHSQEKVASKNILELTMRVKDSNVTNVISRQIKKATL